MHKFFAVTVLLLLGYTKGWTQTTSTAAELKTLLDSVSCKVGVYAISGDGTILLSENSGDRFPMQSVFKFPIAIAVLAMIDEGKLSLDQKVKISKKEMSKNTWSPIREHYPQGAKITIAEILGYTVSQSDNIGCDVLLKLLGGTANVQNYLNEKGFRDISIAVNEADMHRNWDVQFKNWSTPEAMTHLLEAAWNNSEKLLSAESHAFLWKIMTETTTGPKRLKGLLPAGSTVAHKTGSSGTNKGISAATNDVGVIRLPNGKIIFISVFVTDSKENDDTNERIIAELAQLACKIASK